MSAFGSYADTAAREALLRFGPQRSNLADLIREAQQGYASHLGQARTRALGTKAAINHAIPQIRQIFSGAEGASQGTAHLLTSALEGASPDSPYRQSQASESALALQQLVARKASEESRLKQEGVGAQSGLQFAGLAAQQTLAHELRSLLQKRSNLSGEEGTFASTQADKAAKEAAKEAAAERRSLRTDSTAKEGHALTRKSAEEAHGGKGGGKPQSSSAQAKAASSVRSIESLARELAREGHNRGEIEHELSTARPQRTIVVDPKTGQPLPKGEEKGGRSVTTAGRKAYARDVLMQAAIDSAVGYEGAHGDGSVSRAVLKQLRASGYSLKALSLRGPRAAIRRSEAAEGVRGGVNASGK